MSTSYDVIVIGAGVAGLTAAQEAARLGLRVCIFEELMFGGLVVNVNHLAPSAEGLPSAGSDVGAELMAQACDLGAATVFGAVTALDTECGLCVVAEGESHTTRAVIVATGARLRALGVPGEAEFEHRGVSHCADCDAPMFRGQDAVVVGGGDSALQEALVLADFCKQVHLVHRGASFTARAEFVGKIGQRANVVPHMETTVEALLGDAALSRVSVRDAKGAQSEIPCTGFFAYVGLAPNTSFLASRLECDTQGRVKVNAALQSSLSNVYAIGAVRAGYAGQIGDAQADARAAAQAVAQSLGTAAATNP